MSDFSVRILGCGCATPTLRHFPAAQLVMVRGKVFLIDCSEGTQGRLRAAHLHFAALNFIFISHLHGDHCLGLFGMISTFGLLGRKAPLYIHAPEALGPVLDIFLKTFCPHLSYEVVFKPFSTAQGAVIYDDRSLTITTIPLRHSVPCCGFLFKEKPTRKTPDRVLRSYAYCSDTAYSPAVTEAVRGVTTLYHESTYCSDRIDKAATFGHSTAAQAAMVARDAGVEKLVIGHFSARYEDENDFLNEAAAVFPNTILANEGMIVEV